MQLRWATGTVHSNQSRHVRYPRPAVVFGYVLHLVHQVLGWGWAKWVTGSFRTGLFFPAAEFTGQWIGHDLVEINELRKEFLVPSPLTRATIFLAGYYELYLNGTQIDPTRRLDPGWTSWEQDVFYVSYDVTSLLSTRGGPAAMDVRLGSGGTVSSRTHLMGLHTSNVRTRPLPPAAEHANQLSAGGECRQ